MRINRMVFNNIDWVLIYAALILCVISVMTIFSATRPLGGGEQPSFYIKQASWVLVGLAAMAAMISIDYSWLQRVSYQLYGTGIFLLIVVMVMGRTGMGAQRWISIGPISFQPSEFFKLAFLIVIARQFSAAKGAMGVREVLYTFIAFLLLPVLLLLKQPDLGSATVLMGMFFCLVLAKGVARKAAALAVVVALLSVPFVGGIVWDGLKDYQKKRVLSFVQPDLDPDGINYHINQSKVAVGSGGIIGKGYMKGTQGPLRFLPEKHTDFVFAIFAEEWGFLGSTVLLFIYLLIVMRGLQTASAAKDSFGRYLALAITFMFVLYCVINIGMTLGLMPVVGIPLPFMSYGGTAMLSNFIGIGLLAGIRARRFELFY